MNAPLRPIPRRGLSRDEAAIYVGIGTTKFDEMVKDGRMPKPFTIDTLERWDIYDLQGLEIEDVGSGCIYVVTFAQFVKIGWSRNVAKRIRELQIGLPLELTLRAEIPGDAAIEKQLHCRFQAQRTRGEWFLLEGELAAWVEAGCPL